MNIDKYQILITTINDKRNHTVIQVSNQNFLAKIEL